MSFKTGNIIKHNESFKGFIAYEVEREVLGRKLIDKEDHYILKNIENDTILELTVKWVNKTYIKDKEWIITI